MARVTSDKRAARRAAMFIIAIAFGFSGVWALPRVSSAAAGWAVTPPVREKTVRVSGGLTLAPTGGWGGSATTAVAGSGADRAASSVASSIVEPGFRFDMVGVLCDEALPDGSRITVSLRTSPDGRTWSPWFATDFEACGVTVAKRGSSGLDGPDDPGSSGMEGGPAAFTQPVWVGSSRYVELRAAVASGDAVAPATLDGVRLMFLNTSGDGTVTDQVVSSVRTAIATIAGIGAPPVAGAMTTTPDIVRRAEWGADESWRGHDPEYASVKMAFVHHTVNGNSYTRAQAAGLVRGIYYYDTKGLKWSDLGYNFLVDRYGTVYEGRYGGITKGVIGAQTLGFNMGSTGIAMIGTFTSASPPSVMMSALKKLLAWKLDVHHVDPLGSARMTCRWTQKFEEGDTVTLPAIAGHRQANYTACPGDALYRRLPGVRTAVGGMGLPKIYDFAVGTPYVSPNADGVQESTRVRFRNSAPADWSVEAIDDAGTVVRTVTGSGASVDVRWNGRDEDGAVVPDGVYRVVGRASVSGARARAATVSVVVDTVAPAAAAVAVTPAVFSPNADGYADRCRLRFTTAEACSARVSVVATEGAVLRTVDKWRSADAGRRSVTWDGQIFSSGSLVPAPEGEAQLRLELKDAAGNRSSVVTTSRIDRTLGFLTAVPATFSPNDDGVKDSTTFGYTLTRRATVVLEIAKDGDVVRALGESTRAAGTHTRVWDGLLGDGTRAASGTYRFRVTATSAIGVVGAARDVVVDRYRPRLTAPTAITATLGKRARVVFAVADPYSPKVRVTARVRNAAGRTLAVVDCGWVPTGTRTAVLWKPPARRTYSVTLTAVDRGGNREYRATTTTIAVR